MVRDHGKGFDPASANEGFGIKHSIIARLAEVGGTATISSSPGKGTKVELWAPELIGVAIVEDHPLYRQGLIQVVEAVEGLTVVAAVGTLKEIETIGLEGVEVVLLDLHLPDGIGADAVSRVKGLGATIIVISASDDRESVVDAIGAGARGYLPKSSAPDEISFAIGAVASGGTYVSPVLAAYLLRAEREGHARTSADGSGARNTLACGRRGDGRRDR